MKLKVKGLGIKFRKRTAATISLLIFAQNILMANQVESNFWKERKESLAAAQEFPGRPKNKSENAAAILAALPKGLPSINSSFDPSLSDFNLVGDVLGDSKPGGLNRALPEWIQSAVNPYANLHEIYLSPDRKAKTVFLLQDLHLNFEAQLNIAGTIDGLGRALRNQNSKLLVGLEGADLDRADYSITNSYPYRDEINRVAKAMLKVNVLNGAEFAVVGFQGDGRTGPVQPPFDYTGLENQVEYDANVKALREAVPLKERASVALKEFKRSLNDLKAKKYSGDLLKFDSKMSAFEDGSLDLPQFALFLQKYIPPTALNSKTLVEAAAMEKSLDFGRIERDRRRLFKNLLEKLNESEIKELLQLSMMFKAHAVTYSQYYTHLRNLLKRHGIALAAFPEMDRYVQYVLKSESINPSQLFDEIKAWEESAAERVLTTSEQKELAQVTKDYFLLKKISDHILTEEEFRRYEARKEEIHRLPERLAALGGSVPSLFEKMSSHWNVFENFYTIAETRNKTLAGRLADKLKSVQTDYAVLVAGGFHTQGILSHLKKAGLSILVLSPKVTKLEDGISSLDILESGRLPLDKIFVGDRLFLGLAPQTLVPGRSEATLECAETAAEAARNDRDVEVRSRDGRRTVAHWSKDRPREETTDGLILELEGEEFVGVSRYLGQPYPWLEAINEAVRQSPTKLTAIFGIIHRILNLPRPTTTVADKWGSRTVTDMSRLLIEADPVSFIDKVAQMYPAALSQGIKTSSFLLRRSSILSQIDPLLDLLHKIFPHLPSPVQEEIINSASPFESMTGDTSIKKQELDNALSSVLSKWRGPYNRPVPEIDANKIEIRLVKGDKEAQLSELRPVGGNGVRYFIWVSREFLLKHVLSHENLQLVVSKLYPDDPRASEKARVWLLERYLAHELLEGQQFRPSLRRSGVAGEAEQKAHDLLTKFGLGPVIKEHDVVLNITDLISEMMADDAKKEPDLQTFSPQVRALFPAPKPKAPPPAKLKVTPFTQQIPTPKGVLGLAANDKNQVALVGNEAQIFDHKGNQVTKPLQSRVGTIEHVALSRKAGVVAYTISKERADQKERTYRVDTFNLETRNEGGTNEIAQKIISLAITSDGSRVYVVRQDNNKVYVYDPDKFSEMLTGLEAPPEGEVKSLNVVAVSPDDRYVVAAGNDGVLVVWDAKTRKIVAKKAHEDNEHPRSPILSIGFSPVQGAHILAKEKTFVGSDIPENNLNKEDWRLLTGDKAGYIWHWALTPKGLVRSSLRARPPSGKDHPVQSVAVNQEGTRAVCVTRGGSSDFSAEKFEVLVVDEHSLRYELRPDARINDAKFTGENQISLAVSGPEGKGGAIGQYDLSKLARIEWHRLALGLIWALYLGIGSASVLWFVPVLYLAGMIAAEEFGHGLRKLLARERVGLKMDILGFGVQTESALDKFIGQFFYFGTGALGLFLLGTSAWTYLILFALTVVSIEGAQWIYSFLSWLKNMVHPRRPVLITREMAEDVLNRLLKEEPILEEILPVKPQVANYSLGGKRYRDVQFDAQGRLASDEALLNTFTEQNRYGLLRSTLDRGFRFRKLEGAYADAKVGALKSLLVLDAANSMNFLVETYLAQKKKSGGQGRPVLAVLKTRFEFRIELGEYIRFLKLKGATEESQELQNALEVQADLALNDRDSNRGMILIALDDNGSAPKLLPSGEWDVSHLVNFYQSKAREYNLSPQQIVFVSNWRKLILSRAVNIAVRMITSVDIFITTLDGRLKAYSFAALAA